MGLSVKKSAWKIHSSLTVCNNLRMEGKALELLNHTPGVFEYLWFQGWIACEMGQYKTNAAKNVGICNEANWVSS